MGGCCSSRDNSLKQGSVQATLNYSKTEEGKKCGKYAGQGDKGDLIDVHEPVVVQIEDAR